jgi:dihydroorotase-like cyclic amidohydrolase
MPLLHLENVLNPLTGQRTSVRAEGLDAAAPIAEVTIDATDWWLLPGLYDADSHLPLFGTGIRAQDRWRAWNGGVAHTNVAIPWQLARQHDLAALGATRLPRIFPVLGLEDGQDGERFPAWLRDHRDELAETWCPVVKLYSRDPNFERNLDAVWEAGLKAVAYVVEEETVQRVAAADGGPMHFRHAVTAGLVDTMRGMSQVSLQTSPHYLLALDETQRTSLHVLPPVPAEAERVAFVDVAGAGVDILVSDHNAPVPGQTGPGLENQQWFAPALLTLTRETPLELAAVIDKVTAAPAKVFGTQPDLDGAWIVVDPNATVPGSSWPGQAPDRTPYLGRELTGAVRAIGADGYGFAL